MKTIHCLLASVFLLASQPVWAHGDKAHQSSSHAVKEQKEWGIAGEPQQVKRTITLVMTDKMRFTPDRIEVKQGETVRLRVRNAGKLMHELVIGTPKELAAHAAMMAQHPGMAHDEPYMVHVAPGKTGDLIWTFNRAGEFEFACLIAGHFQAGMKGTIRVTASHTATNPQPYAGEQQRAIKALSPHDTKAYQEGQGHGFAKAAELNGYPGPMHTLELADKLLLSADQRRQTQELITRHKAEAKRLGAELLAAEEALDQAFAERKIDAESLQRLTLAAGEKLAQLRLEHLRTHLSQTALLTSEQIARYKHLRGYGQEKGSDVATPQPEKNDGHKHH